MKIPHLRLFTLAITLGCALSVIGQDSNYRPTREDRSRNNGGFPPPGFDGQPPFGPGPGGFGPGGPGGFGPRGPGGMVRGETKLVQQFDKDGDKRLNKEERKEARAFIAGQRGNRGPGGPGGRRGGFGGPRDGQEPPKPGPRVSTADVVSYPNAPLYASNVLRTVFLDFEESDWEKELEDFHGTDVDVSAKLTVDGKTYPDVGVHFRGASSYMMIGEGRKRSLNLSIDFAHEDQAVGGYRTLNLLNAHEDPTFLRTVLYFDTARSYVPAPKANWVRLVINGESWGVYINVQQFNKDFTKEWFGSKKGARWKVPGSPGGQGSLAYLGEDAAPYRRIYEIKSKDDTKSWTDLIKLCKVLNETPAGQLEAALAPLLDIDGALKFLALENALINNDGYWIRTSDYDIYEDEKGRFHIIPYDANETFSIPGGPGFGGGPGGPGGPGGFGPGMMLSRHIFAQGDLNEDQKLSKEEFTALADVWFDKLDPDNTGKVSQEQLVTRLPNILPPPPGFGPQGFGPRDGDQRGGGQQPDRRRFGPAPFLAQGIFQAADTNKDGSLTRAELKDTFTKWFAQWDAEKSGALSEEKLRNGFATVLPEPGIGGFGGGPGGPDGRPGRQGGRRGFGGPGFGGGLRVNGVELDPLIAANDPNKPLISKLLAVPALRARYLGYVRDIAEKWLDWNQLSPRVMRYQALISDEVKADTRKLSSFEAFQRGIAGDSSSANNRGPERPASLKSFAEQRRTYLLNYPAIKQTQ